MAAPPKIRVMISSRCNDPILLDGGEVTLSDVRLRLKKELEETELFGSQLFDVWINEDAPPAEGSTDSWNLCQEQVRKADIVLVLYNGNSGWAKEGGDIGICHAELQTALSTAPAKVRLIKLPVQPPGTGTSKGRDERFRDYVQSQNLFRGTNAETGEDVISRCKEALREAVADMVHLGVREARKGKFHVGDALDWSRLDFQSRRKVMEKSLREALLERNGAEEYQDHVFVRIGKKPVQVLCHGIPAAITVPAAREMIGQPFLRDHTYVSLLEGQHVGPVHFIACHHTVTEAQAMKQLGFPDATIVLTPFGVYVADNIQKIQLVFIANCRDDTTTRHGIQRVFDWLEQSGEDILLSRRAEARKRIIKAIAKEVSE